MKIFILKMNFGNRRKKKTILETILQLFFFFLAGDTRLTLIYRHDIIGRARPVPNYCILLTKTVVLCSLTDAG